MPAAIAPIRGATVKANGKFHALNTKTTPNGCCRISQVAVLFAKSPFTLFGFIHFFRLLIAENARTKAQLKSFHYS
jgi:hypothetical protein